MKKLVLLGALLVIGLLVAACAPQVVKIVLKPVVEVPVTVTPEPTPTGEVRLTAADEGRQIELAEGQTLAIALESNPTTGFGWEVEELDEDVLKKLELQEFEPQSKLVGAPGIQTLYFQALDVGETTLKLVYRRSWEKNVEPLKTYSVELIVR